MRTSSEPLKRTDAFLDPLFDHFLGTNTPRMKFVVLTSPPFVFWILISFQILLWAVQTFIHFLNLKSPSASVIQRQEDFCRKEFLETYPPQKLQEARVYQRVHSVFSIVRSTTILASTILFLCVDGLAWTWTQASLLQASVFPYLAHPPAQIVSGLIFWGALGLGRAFLNLPFSIYSIFNIESRFGFNRMTVKLFIQDLMKGLGLTIFLGGTLGALVLGVLESYGSDAWFFAWVIFILFQLVLQFLAPVLILPLFFKFEPIPPGPLFDAIQRTARVAQFPLSGTYSMDGSRRSAKSNAFFTGFGRFRKLVLFDTLIKNHSIDELVAVFAHEVGHFKKGHIPKATALGILELGLTFWLLSIVVKSSLLFDAFHIPIKSSGSPPVAVGLVLFGFVVAPLQWILSGIQSAFSRRQEFEADAMAAEITGQPEALVSALKKLSANNLSFPFPHPVQVALEYSHPPLPARMEALRKFSQRDGR